MHSRLIVLPEAANELFRPVRLPGSAKPFSKAQVLVAAAVRFAGLSAQEQNRTLQCHFQRRTIGETSPQ